MLPADSRLTRSADFAATVRRSDTSARAARATLVVHLGVDPQERDQTTDPHADVVLAATPRAGFVVSKAVGPAVVRNRVRRRLRHLVRPVLADLPAGSRLVVRALPAAAGAPGAVLESDLTSAVSSATATLRRRSVPPRPTP